MGAFFLYKTGDELELKEAGRIFTRKGFDQPAEFELGSWSLWLFRKQTLRGPNYFSEDQWAVFCCGTVAYYGLGYEDSMKRTLRDFREKRLELKEFIGNFCILLWDGKRLFLLTDQFNIQHVFFNAEKTCISTSFLAVLSASPKALKLNQLAVCEKLSTGYIVSPDTLVEGIYKLDDANKAEFNSNRDEIEFITHPNSPAIQLHRDGIEDSISCVTATLEKHFQGVDALHSAFSGELGLSSGYDSRLVLACSKFLSLPLSIHTHATAGVHDIEAGKVKNIADGMGLPLVKVVTRGMEEQPKEQIENILRDGLYFFDGRCSHNMGAFSETYSRGYKLRVLGAHGLSWSGLGGEIYRNYYLTNRASVNLRRWMDDRVYYRFSKEAIANQELYEEMHQRKVRKMSQRIGSHFLNSRVSFLDLRRYYSEIRMPECDGVNNNAHNQIAFFHTPFFDPKIVYEGINATPYIGCDGLYQAKLITRLNPALAAYQSHYGHPFDYVPTSYLVKCWVKGKMPDTLRYARAKMVSRRRSKGFLPGFINFINNTPVLMEIKTILSESVLKGSFEKAMIDYAQRPTTLFIGSFLREFQTNIKW